MELTHAEHKANGNAAYQQKQYRTAIGHYTLAIGLSKEELELLKNQQAEDESSNNNLKAVLPQLATLLASYYGNRAAAFTMLLEHQEALDDCDRAIQVDPKAIKAYFRKAKILFTLGRLDESLKAYSYGMIHDPNNAKAIKERADVQTIQKRFQLANEALQKTDNHPKKNARQALAQIELVLASCPTWGAATLTKIDALVRLHRIEAALALSTQLMTQDGYESNNDLIFLRAQCLFYQANIEGTMNHLRNILASDPDNTKAFQMVKMVRALKKIKQEADTAYKARNYEQAIALYVDAIAACPTENKAFTAKLYLNRALSHNGLRQHSECVADCTLALTAADEDYPKAVLRRAASLLLLGGKDEIMRAIRDYDHYANQGWAKTQEEQADLRKKMQNAKVQLKRVGKKDLYKIMGVSRDATDAEIKKSYRKMALKHHVRLLCIVVVCAYV